MSGPKARTSGQLASITEYTYYLLVRCRQLPASWQYVLLAATTAPFPQLACLAFFTPTSDGDMNARIAILNPLWVMWICMSKWRRTAPYREEVASQATTLRRFTAVALRRAAPITIIRVHITPYFIGFRLCLHHLLRKVVLATKIVSPAKVYQLDYPPHKKGAEATIPAISK